MTSIFFQEPVTPIAEGIVDVHHYICYYLIWIGAFISYIMYQTLIYYWYKIHYPATANDVYFRSQFLVNKKVTHYSKIETIWTLIPAFILLLISIPSFQLVYAMEVVDDSELVVKVEGHQWYWGYQIDPAPVDSTIASAQSISINKHMICGITIRFVEYLRDVDWLIAIYLWQDIVHCDFMDKAMETAFALEEAGLTNPNDPKPLGPLTIKKYKTMRVLYENNVPIAFYCFDSPAQIPSDSGSSSNHSTKNSTHIASFTTQEDLQKGERRMLTVDNQLIVPTEAYSKFLITSIDVLHSWALPSLGVKVDAIPGRVNQFPFYILRDGVFLGQCSELCGVAHAEMPIVLRSVSVHEFLASQNL